MGLADVRGIDLLARRGREERAGRQVPAVDACWFIRTAANHVDLVLLRAGCEASHRMRQSTFRTGVDLLRRAVLAEEDSLLERFVYAQRKNM